MGLARVGRAFPGKMVSSEHPHNSQQLASYKRTIMRIVTLSLFLAGLSVHAQNADYGVDCSFPIHSKEFKCGNLLGDRKKIYEEFMEGCRKFYGKKGARCDSTENDRIEMSQRQPQSMVVSKRFCVRMDLA